MWIILLSIIALAAALLLIPQLKGYRTIAFNVVVANSAMLAELLSLTQGIDWTQYVPMSYIPWIGLTVAAINVLLRYATSGPVGEK